MQTGLNHHFNVEIATEVGINAAVIACNIQHWCAKNEANESERHFHNDRYWTFNTMKAFEKLFPYLTLKQIRTALTRLEEAEIIYSGRFNKDARDRTKWYSYNGIEQRVMHLPLRADDNCPEGQIPFAPEGRPLPDINPNNKPNKTLARARAGAPWMGSLRDALGPKATTEHEARRLNQLLDEALGFDGRRVLVVSAYAKDTYSNDLSKALKAANLVLTDSEADMRMEEDA